MIRYKLSAQKQFFIGVIFLSSVILMGLLKAGFQASEFLTLTHEARIEVYLIGVFAALLYMSRDWSVFLGESLLRAPFEGALLAARLAFYQSIVFGLIYFLLRDIATSRSFLIWFILCGLPINAVLITWLPPTLRKFFNRSGSAEGLLIGSGTMPQELVDYAKRCRDFGVHFRGYYGDIQDSAPGFDRLGRVADVGDETFGSESKIEQVIFYGDHLDDEDCQSALNVCYRHGARVQIMLHARVFSGYHLRHVVDGDSHFLTFAVEPLKNPLNSGLKRMVDLAISIPMLLLVLPLLIVVVWFGQRMQSPGPLFFQQSRHGLDRRMFSILKFRTMEVSVDDEAKQAVFGDARVYPLGRILRRFSLDEVPQFINVLRGEMSVIGPRPHLTAHDELFEKEIGAYRIRHYIKPGITGYAQIRGFRGEVTSPEQINERVRHDIYYISHWSPKLDVYIFFKTLATVLWPPDSAV